LLNWIVIPIPGFSGIKFVLMDVELLLLLLEEDDEELLTLELELELLELDTE